MPLDLDLGAVRAFTAITEDRYFGEAATRLGISQQAISKRIAKLESDLGVRLFFRTRAGADLTEDGRAFLHHARSLVGLADQAVDLLRGRRRALRVDVLDTRLRSVELLRAFHQTVEDVDIEILTSNGLRSAHGALTRGSVDVFFSRVIGTLDEELRHIPAYLEPVHLLVSRDHPLAGRQHVEMERLSGSTVWMPGNTPGSEWADFYNVLGAAFDIQIDTSGPDFGWEHFMERIGSGEHIGFGGEELRLPWNPRTVQIPLVDPAPVYPCSLLYHRQNHHPVLALLTRFIQRAFRPFDSERQWLPAPDRAAFTVDRT
ncbi:LysR family transcriptional regulator [Nonomuraea terrae]|uniref:LysR family transcriptional regulator n=1 Tax=Nonomuraea terrae TaxID=2530383 RepID=UPI001CB709E3|nr:LysR family transcriptional regulator [Nonomuraea terrae]